jgi:hypothetical protein
MNMISRAVILIQEIKTLSHKITLGIRLVMTGIKNTNNQRRMKIIVSSVLKLNLFFNEICMIGCSDF